MGQVYLSVDAVLAIHRQVIEGFGGDPGLRDRGLLEAAVAMPLASFGGSELHPALADKAGAYHFHLCANHPFVDGNQRVAVAAAEVFLLVNGMELQAGDDDVFELTMGVADRRASKEQVLDFFRSKSRGGSDG